MWKQIAHKNYANNINRITQNDGPEKQDHVLNGGKRICRLYKTVLDDNQ